ncbi:hypothetical protein GQ55_5G292300 [Panicum hallii var. hallii]|uniref:Uncharacterized protein n=1 Tax=Panicum hallii var. hallii TaxID=1504633 RepID=A0A2T7DLC3_9POAL|nr:hypothetical protein GQ55_5G292300 [Panicum hallii var. hallii]
MARFLRRAALAVASALGSLYRSRPFTGLFLAPSPPSASDHLGLVRSRPGLLDLNSLFTPEAFLLDATHALAAAALRHQPFLGWRARTLPEAAGGCGGPRGRPGWAPVHGPPRRGGRPLRECARRPGAPRRGTPPPRPAPRRRRDLRPARTARRGRPLAGRITGDQPLREDILYRNAVLAATLGGRQTPSRAPRARLWGTAFDGDMSVIKKVLVTVLLNCLVKTKLNKDAVVSLHGVVKLLRSGTGSSIAPSSTIPIFAFAKGTAQFVLQASQALLSAVVLRAPRLTGERIRVATRDLARAMERGDTAADLRLLLAFLAARDGRFNEAMAIYMEAAQEHPSDPRPHYLLHLLFLFGEHMEESNKWKANYERLAAGSSDEDRAAHMVLKEELVVALTLGGARSACSESYPAVLRVVVGGAGSRVNAALVSALQDKGLSVIERLELRAIRTYVYGEMWSALKGLKP